MNLIEVSQASKITTQQIPLSKHSGLDSSVARSNRLEQKSDFIPTTFRRTLVVCRDSGDSTCPIISLQDQNAFEWSCAAKPRKAASFRPLSMAVTSLGTSAQASAGFLHGLNDEGEKLRSENRRSIDRKIAVRRVRAACINQRCYSTFCTKFGSFSFFMSPEGMHKTNTRVQSSDKLVSQHLTWFGSRLMW